MKSDIFGYLFKITITSFHISSKSFNYIFNITLSKFHFLFPSSYSKINTNNIKLSDFLHLIFFICLENLLHVFLHPLTIPSTAVELCFCKDVRLI